MPAFLLAESSPSLDKHRLHLQFEIQLPPPQSFQRIYQKEKWAAKLMLLKGKCPFKVYEMHKDIPNFTSKTSSKGWKSMIQKNIAHLVLESLWI